MKAPINRLLARLTLLATIAAAALAATPQIDPEAIPPQLSEVAPTRGHLGSTLGEFLILPWRGQCLTAAAAGGGRINDVIHSDATTEAATDNGLSRLPDGSMSRPLEEADVSHLLGEI